MNLPRLAPDWLANLSFRSLDLAGNRRLDLDIPVCHRNNNVGQIMPVPPFALAWLHSEIPDAHTLVFKHDAVPDGAQGQLVDILRHCTLQVSQTSKSSQSGPRMRSHIALQS